MGRMASRVAKQALLGERIDIVNCEKAVVTGKRQMVLAHYQWRRELGSRPTKGPFFPAMSDRFVRRIVRGMLPYKQEKGEKAFKRVMCYRGLPPEFQGKKLESFSDIDVRKAPSMPFVTVEEICKHLKEQP